MPALKAKRPRDRANSREASCGHRRTGTDARSGRAPRRTVPARLPAWLLAELPALEREASALRRRRRRNARGRLGRAGRTLLRGGRRLGDAGTVCQHLTRRAHNANAAIRLGALAARTDQRADALVDRANRLEGVERRFVLVEVDRGELGEIAQRRARRGAELAVDAALEAADALEFQLQRARDLAAIDLDLRRGFLHRRLGAERGEPRLRHRAQRTLRI